VGGQRVSCGARGSLKAAGLASAPSKCSGSPATPLAGYEWQSRPSAAPSPSPGRAKPAKAGFAARSRGFQPLGPEQPDHNHLLKYQELWLRYLPSGWTGLFQGAQVVVITHECVEDHLCRTFSHRRGAEGAETDVFSSDLCVLCTSAVRSRRSPLSSRGAQIALHI
jgi:hypothetical protein